jgi:hypothetical protein
MGNCLPGAAVALPNGISQANQAPPTVKGCYGDHQSPKMPKVTGPHQFAGLAKETLAEKREFAYPGHWVFPSWPGPGESWAGTYNNGTKDPFSLQDQSVSRVLAPMAFTV